MAIWNTSYELNPQNYRNPGEGAFHLRDVKEAVRERGAVEHVWGDDEATIGTGSKGWHLEGSARAHSSDGAQSFRPQEEQISDTVRPGRIVVSSSNVSPLREQDGVDLQDVAGYTYRDQRSKKIQVAVAQRDTITGALTAPTDPTATELLDIFDYDELVDIHQDQTIKGIKTFETEARVPDVTGLGTTEENWEAEAAKVDGSELVAVNVKETYEQVNDAKFHNSFDPDITSNSDRTVADTGSPSGDVVQGKIYVQEIYATKVQGAVWG